MEDFRIKNNGLVAAVDLGETKCAAALVNREGERINYSTTGLAGAGGSDVASMVTEVIETLLAHAALHHLQVTGIGISIAGISEQERGTVWSPYIEGWEKFPLHGYLKDHLTRQDLPVRIENNRGASLLGEHWLGAAKETNNAIFLSVGTGIGSGILSEGRLIRGAHGIAGSVGWMALQRPFDAKYKRSGNLQYNASANGMIRTAGELASRSNSRFFQKEKNSYRTLKALFDSYETKDPVAVKVINQAIELWGMACANLVSLFNPEVIIFGGEVFGPGTRYMERIYREAIRWAQPVAMRRVQFVPSELGVNASLMGAACLLFQDPAL